MERKLLFEMPNDIERRVQLLGLIPKDWLIDGELHATQKLVEEGKALANTGVRLDKHLPPQIIGHDFERGVRLQPDLLGLVSSYYGFARFSEAGGHNFKVFETDILQAVIMLKKGFEGDLHFYLECQEGSCRCCRVAHCNMQITAGASLLLKWDSGCRTASAVLAQLSAGLKEMGLKELGEESLVAA